MLKKLLLILIPITIISCSDSKPEIIQDLEYLMYDKGDIDYEDHKLNNILNKYEQPVFKAYKAFIEYDKSAKTPADIEKAEKYLQEVGETFYTWPYYEEDTRSQSEKTLDDFLFHIANIEATEGIEMKTNQQTQFSNQIPIWLALKHPKILNGSYSAWHRYPVGVKALGTSFTGYEIIEVARKMQAEHFGYITSYSGQPGTIYRDYAGREASSITEMLYAPRNYNFNADELADHKKAIAKKLLNLEEWSTQGLWNQLLYKKFKRQFEKSAKALGEYYRGNYGFAPHAENADLILASFIKFMFPYNNGIEKPGFKIIAQANGDFAKLKELAETSKEHTSELLARAILAGYDKEAIKWIIESAGADINGKFMEETPLMNAANNPEILKLLIDLGAKIDSQTPIGKTALFYSIQFGNLETVKILVEAGADVNHPIKSYDHFVKMWEKMLGAEGPPAVSYMPETIADFTPLVYAKRYADETVIRYLEESSAKMGAAGAERVESWIKGGKMDL